MDKQKVLKKVDHTILKPTATWADVEKILKEAQAYKTASACIPPHFVKQAKAAFPELVICTVIGFPLGYNSKAVKFFETKDAVASGADEIDMVVNLCLVKEGRFDLVTEEIAAVKNACGGKLLKVIVETCYLSEEEKVALCKAVTLAGAEYIKTSTGFGTAGAQAEDIALFKKHIGSNVKIKASGGIRTKEDIEKMIENGADRIGASAAVNIYK